MRVERLGPGGTPEELAARLRALAPGAAAVSEDVAAIVAAVREGGDAALLRYVERFDATGGAAVARHPRRAAGGAGRARPRGPRRPGGRRSPTSVPSPRRAPARTSCVELPQGHTVLLREMPVRRAAIYAPGGRNPYPSTVVMGAVTAQAAGVDEVVVCAPGAHPVILAACALCGVDEVLRMGGAHAVAALAYGTESVASRRRHRRAGRAVGAGGQAPGLGRRRHRRVLRAKRRRRHRRRAGRRRRSSPSTSSRRPSTARGRSSPW